MQHPHVTSGDALLHMSNRGRGWGGHLNVDGVGMAILSELKWEAPPPKRGGGKQHTAWHSIAEELKRRPWEWAIIAENVSCGTSTNISAGTISAFRPAGSFECALRGVSHGKAEKLYVRYVGVGEEPATAED